MFAILILPSSGGYSRNAAQPPVPAADALPSAELIRYLGQFSDVDGAFLDPLELAPELLPDGEPPEESAPEDSEKEGVRAPTPQPEGSTDES